MRGSLHLEKIECINKEEATDDEFYILVDGRRYGVGQDHWWKMGTDDVEKPEMVIDRRVRPNLKGTGDSNVYELYDVEIKAYEADCDYEDWDWYDDLTDEDDPIETESVLFSHYPFSTTFKYSSANTIEYKLWFNAEIEYFNDPSPLNAQGDKDKDGIVDHVEFDVSTKESIYGNLPEYDGMYNGISDPETKQIFVEVDWMKSGSTEYKMREDAQIYVKSSFIKEEIYLHIDDGSMGGGSKIDSSDYEDKMTYDEWTDLYNEYFVNENPNRVGIFHHCVMSHLFEGKYWGKDSSNWDGAGEYNGDRFTINKKASGSSDQASTFMHELGHGINLIPSVFDGIDSKKYSFDEYHSCMNYNAPDDYIDYSSGGAFNDWNNIDLTKFN